MTQNKGPKLIEAKFLNFQNLVAIARVLKIYEMVLSIQLFGFVSLLKTHEKTTWTENHGTVQTKCIQIFTKIYTVYTMCCLKATHNSSLLISDV